MKIMYVKSLWGMEGDSLENNLNRIAAAGYGGVESGLPWGEDRDNLLPLLKKYNLSYVGMAFTGGANASEHIASLRSQLEELAPFHPLSVTVHGARDSFSWEEQQQFFAGALALEKEFGLPISHETHRGRPTFTPWTTAKILREFPELQLATDFSHWVCVCESHLSDNEEDVTLAIQQTRHIHARVGHPEGPQVSDPAAPEWKAELDLHVGWWKRIAEIHKAQGKQLLTITPEFGPPGYMPTLPYTKQPVSDLWEVCLWMKDYLQKQLSE